MKTASSLSLLFILSVSVALGATITGTYDNRTADGSQTTGTGPWTMTSTDSTYSLLTFYLDPGQVFTFGDLTNLSVNYDAIFGGIGGGSPRMAVVFTDSTDLLALFGPAGSFSDPTLGPGNSGNLVALNDTGRYDLSGSGGSFYTNYSAALALDGSKTVDHFTLIVDSFSGNDKNFTINSFDIQANLQTTVPEPKTWVLGFLGFGGFLLYRRRQRLA